MRTSPSIVFRDSLNEVRQLLTIHTQLTGTDPGRRHKVEILNKSSIIFACAAFEAFVEELAKSAFDHIVEKSENHNVLPKPILQAIADSLKKDNNEIKVWDLAGKGWKRVVGTYRTNILSKYVGSFNTPKPDNINKLIQEMIGLQNLSSAWSWKRMSTSASDEKLKAFCKLRGALAHGENPAPTVRKNDVTSYLGFLATLSVRSSNRVRDYCHEVTGSYPWEQVYFGAVR